MKSVGEFFRFFRKNAPTPCTDFAEVFLSEHPAFPAEAFVCLTLYFYRLFHSEDPRSEDLRELEFLLFRKSVSADPETIFREARNPDDVRKNALAFLELSMEERVLVMTAFLRLFQPVYTLPAEQENAFRDIGLQIGLDKKNLNEILAADERGRRNREKVLSSGAGLVMALVILLIFGLAATFLKVVFFGFIIAYFFLPLEKYFENTFFRSAFVSRTSKILSFIFSPLRRLRTSIERKAGLLSRKKSRKEQEEGLRESLIMKSSLATLFSIGLFLFLFLSLTVSLLIPAAVNTGASINEWAKNNSSIKHMESAVSQWLKPAESTAQKSFGQPQEAPVKVAEEQTVNAPLEVAGENKKDSENFVKWVRRMVLEYVNRHEDVGTAVVSGWDIISFLFSFSGMLEPVIKDSSAPQAILSFLFNFVRSLGIFAFDILLCVFFFFYFLQKLALFSSDMGKKSEHAAKDGLGAWSVRGIFDSGWLPATSPGTREEAAAIIDRICLMFKAWVRGYFSIIIVETILYTVLFTVFSVPYALPLALVAGCTILLPFIGPVFSYILTISICLAFLESHMVFTLIGVSCVYLLINGVLEQLFLYPSLVGGSIGLTTLETIIVVLIGGVFAGITGMIFAVPSAAVLKYLIPKIYKVWTSDKN